MPPESLKAYSERRDFTRTTEPKPSRTAKGGRQFVVQKHDARRLHFDLRLELDGVLKSWAVTRGPSLNPDDKRLAIETEDHPIDYLEWEGSIPKSEYGGGTMIVWDRGQWQPTGDARKGLKKGHLEFTLEGARLKGRWHLVRMNRKTGDKSQPWLLIKSKDEHATGADIVTTETTSVLSGRSNAEMAGELRADHKARASTAASVSSTKRAGAKKAMLPVFVEPSLAALADKVPEGRQWLHEIKYDGYRIQARLDGGKVKLLTRTGLDWTSRFPSIAAAFRAVPAGSALFDGEIVVQEANGLTSFSSLQADLKSRRADRLACFLFDLLYLDGSDLRGVKLGERKTLLKRLAAAFPAGSILRFSDHLEEDGATILGHACRMGLEGIVSKRIDLPYRSGRGDHWLKTKCVARQEFVIVGYLPSTATTGAVGSLVLGYYEDSEIVYAGRAGTGYSAASAAELRANLDKLSASKPSFRNQLPAGAAKAVKWVKPKLIAEIEFRGWTHDGLLRQAAFKGLREDKAPSDIHLEAPKKAKSKPAAAMRFTHPDRILWPKPGITKQGLGEFYADIAKWILPHITGRPLSLLRCPAGAEQPCFYVKHAWAGTGDAIRQVPVGSVSMMAIDGIEGLLALVQANVLEIHPWGSRLETIETPDRLTIDLDPGEGVAWQSVIDAAFEVRDRLNALKLASFVKTSGGKGLHVVVPIVPEASWETAKAFSKRLAEAMAADAPRRFLAKSTKSARRGKIFIDYLRNGRGATAVAAFSTRARPDATVSLPLDWSELSGGLRSDHFTIGNLRQRLDHLRNDPWAGFAKERNKLPLR